MYCTWGLLTKQLGGIISDDIDTTKEHATLRQKNSDTDDDDNDAYDWRITVELTPGLLTLRPEAVQPASSSQGRRELVEV